MASIEDWLASLGLGEYAERFHANAIDLSVVGELTEQDLKDLEIPLGHRRKLLRAIAEAASSPLSPPPAPVRPPAAARDNAAQRRQLTVMFCDLVGSTALSAKLDPEDMQRVISAYQGCIAEVVGRHRGMIARYMGDGALIYFGYPQANEDDVEQAVHTGLELIDAIPNLRTGLDVTMQVCVGIATGTVVVGDILTAESGVREHTVVGDTPNLAARLQTVAEPGAVAVCENTRRLTEAYFSYRDLGEVTLKGWPVPMRVWQPLGATGLESRFEAQHQTGLLPLLLGREEEIELLMRRWRIARQGDGRAVLLTGEPGIGKSHISLAFQEMLQQEPHTVLSYYCSSHHTNSALLPFMGQLERAAGFDRNDAPAAKREKLEALLSKSDAPAGDALALLGSLLSLPPDPQHPLPALSPQRQKEATLHVILAQLERLAKQQPVLMIFEDVHWIDPTSLELLSLIVDRLPQQRILLLMTARQEFTAPWPGHAYVSTVLLTRLSRQNGAALIGRITGGKSLPDEVLSQILARTDGIPLFLEELTKTVLESGQLQERSDQYVFEKSLPSLAIPTTLQASLMARLDRLASVRDVAQIGAVIGREFSYELLSEVAGLPKNKLDEALDQLVQAELIFRRGSIPRAVFSFKHALVRDAAYAGLLKSRRAQLHAALAAAFEQKFPEIAEAQPETLALHLTEAGLAENAVRYWLQAGRKAVQRSAHIEAIAHLKQGLDAVRSIAAGPKPDRTELDLLMEMGPCLIATQGPAGSDAMATFMRARGLCERLGDPPEYLQVMFWLTTASVMRGELSKAQETIDALLERVEARNDRPALLNAMRGRAMILLFMGQIAEAGVVIKRAFAAFNYSSEDDRLAARAAGQDAGVADLALMSWTVWLLGQPDTAAARIDAALARADAINHPHSQAYACYYASVVYALRDQPGLARVHAERCLTLSETHGFRQWHGLSRAIRGICATMLDETSGRLDDVTAALEEYRNAGYQLGITALYTLLSSVLLLRGQNDAALEIIERGLSTVDHNGERLFEAELYRLKARALQNSGAQGSEVQALLERALLTAQRQGAKSIELRVARDLAQWWLGRNEKDKAREILAPLCDWFTEGSQIRTLTDARALLGTL